MLIHLSAWRKEDESFWNPERYIDNNIRDLSTLLTKNNFSKVVFASSYAVYDGKGNLEPASIYGLTKLAGEKLVRIYCKNHWILRIGQPYGPYDRFSVFYRLSECLKLGEVFRLHTGPLKRDYFHVSHLCEVIARIVEGKIKPGTHNVASGHEVCPGKVFLELCRKYNIAYESVSIPRGTSIGYVPTDNLIPGGHGDIEEEWLKYL